LALSEFIDRAFCTGLLVYLGIVDSILIV